ncbi:MAG: serine hydroxymethyltransferase, partial [Ferruginibacter sp.]|nr:serine hydroxymethyltransferase [Rhodoferax sp.]
VGTAAGTTRGFGVAEFEEVGRLMLEVFNSLKTKPQGDAVLEASVYARVKALTARFPLYA